MKLVSEISTKSKKQKMPHFRGIFHINIQVLLTQIHFSSRVQFIKLIVFQIVYKQNAFSG